MSVLLQINSVVNYGSTGRIAEDLARVAINKGWESYIAYGRYSRSSQSQLIKIGNDIDVKIHGIETRIFDNHGFSSKSATYKLITDIKRIQPTIIHLHNLHGYYINIEILFKYLANVDIPVVWTLHDCWAFTGHCTYFSYVGCEKWKSYCNKCPLKKSYPASYFKDNSENNFEKKRELFTSINNITLVPVSNWLGDLISESFFCELPVKVINNGVDTNIFREIDRSELSIKYNTVDKFVMIGVANKWDKRKGIEDYIKLSSFLKIDEIIILVGLSKKQIESLPSNMIGIERTENIHELVELYNLAEIVLNLSYEETFGMTTVEGFACGTPSIVYNATASPELITSEVGYIVEPGNINQLSDAIFKIKSKGKDYYHDACVNRAKEMYDKNSRFEEYIELYESMTKKTDYEY